MTDKDFIPQPPEDDQVWAQGAKDTKEGTDVPKEGAPAQASESTELE